MLALLAGLHVHVEPLRFFVLQWFVYALNTLCPTPGGMLGAETAFYTIFCSFVPMEMIGLVTAGWRFFTFYFLIAASSVVFVTVNLAEKHALGKAPASAS